MLCTSSLPRIYFCARGKVTLLVALEDSSRAGRAVRAAARRGAARQPRPGVFRPAADHRPTDRSTRSCSAVQLQELCSAQVRRARACKCNRQTDRQTVQLRPSASALSWLAGPLARWSPSSFNSSQGCLDRSLRTAASTLALYPLPLGSSANEQNRLRGKVKCT